jgi:outer membrane biogenesis lipoprotein LolB
LNLRQRRGRCSCAQTRALVLAVLGSWILTGCSITPVPPSPTEVPARQWNAGEIVQALQQRDEQFRSLRALARLDYAGPEGKNSFQEAILVQRPDRLRLETLSFLGAIMIVTVDDQEILGYLPREDVFLRGQRSKENLRRLTKIPLPLEVEEITALLLGLPPVNTRETPQQDGNSLSLPAADGGQDIVAFETNDAVPTRWERLNAGGEAQISVKFSDYVPTPAGLFPSRIAIESAIQKRRLEVRYQEPELNATLPAEIFSQQKPPNVKELPIEALGG